MRPSPLKHTLAVLRQIIGLGQKEMGDMVDRSPRTIQAIELGNLPLTGELAKRICRETGISLEWLMRNDINIPPVDSSNVPYTKEHFEKTQAENTKPFEGIPDIMGVNFALNYYILIIASKMLQAIKDDNYNLFNYRLKTALESLTEFPEDKDYQEKSKVSVRFLSKTAFKTDLTTHTCDVFLKEVFSEFDRKLQKDPKLAAKHQALIADWKKHAAAHPTESEAELAESEAKIMEKVFGPNPHKKHKAAD